MPRWSSAGSGVALAIVVLAFPFLVNAYWLSVGVLALFYAIVAASWALLAGYAGQFSFGHMAFVSLGAYTSGLLVTTLGVPIPVGVAAGVVLCALVGAGIGYVCLRMRGPYLALFTVAFSEVLRIVIVSENEVTGGSGGLEVPAWFAATTDMPVYYLGVALRVVSMAIMLGLVASRWGLFFRAIRENEDAAATAGVKVVRFRILAFAITSSFAGLAGGVLRSLHRYIDARYRVGGPDGAGRCHGGDRWRREPGRRNDRGFEPGVFGGGVAELWAVAAGAVRGTAVADDAVCSEWAVGVGVAVRRESGAAAGAGC